MSYLVTENIMEIFKYLTGRNFAKIDREIIRNNKLSLMAFKLYAIYCSIGNGRDFSDEALASELNVCIKTIKRAKKELVDNGLVKVIKLSPRRFVILIRDTDTSFEDVNRHRVNERNTTEFFGLESKSTTLYNIHSITESNEPTAD